MDILLYTFLTMAFLIAALGTGTFIFYWSYKLTKMLLCKMFGHKPTEEVVGRRVITARCEKCNEVIVIANRPLHNDKWYIAEERFESAYLTEKYIETIRK